MGPLTPTAYRGPLSRPRWSGPTTPGVQHVVMSTASGSFLPELVVLVWLKLMSFPPGSWSWTVPFVLILALFLLSSLPASLITTISLLHVTMIKPLCLWPVAVGHHPQLESLHPNRQCTQVFVSQHRDERFVIRFQGELPPSQVVIEFFAALANHQCFLFYNYGCAAALPKITS